MQSIKIYDTTLRDGQQAEGITYSLVDKLRIAQKLDEFGVHYIEGGWPGSNPKDAGFFTRIKNIPLKTAKIAAFGSTRHAKNTAATDPNIVALLKAETPVVTIFGKSWDLHVRDALRVTPKENLDMIYDSVSYLKKQGREVIYDAEHFFDGYKSNPQYAIKTLQAASEAGAEVLALCDTNGGTMPGELAEIIRKTKQAISTPLGIHVHNDSGLAVANSLVAVEEGAVQVQGTINGFGERCGNADLSAIIPNLVLKYDISCIPKDNLKMITEVSRFVAETANMVPNDKQPYVGYSAFAHKAGIHVSAIQRNPETYEHTKPELVGNIRRVLVSDQAGKSNVFFKTAELGIALDKATPEAKEIVNRIKELESLGYEFEAADGTFELLVKKAVGKHRSFFNLEGFRVIVEKRGNRIVSEATIKVRVDDQFEHTAAEGDGPVDALDHALRKALMGFYPQLKKVRLTDYKVRVLDAKSGTGAKVRVLIESTDGKNEWGTVGISENILEASWLALVDSIEYQLLKDEEKKGK
ncbi:MAG: citramalate synthase [bacterium]